MSRLTETNILGGVALDALLGSLPVKMEKNIMRGALRAGAKVFLQQVKQNIPVDKGALRASARVTTRARRGEVTASVKVGDKNVYYAQMVEFGTRQHVIRATADDLGVNRRTGRIASYRTLNRRVLVIGRAFVGPVVDHPGARPRPFMRPAADAAFPAAVAAVQAYVRQRLTAQGLEVPEPTPAGEREE